MREGEVRCRLTLPMARGTVQAADRRAPPREAPRKEAGLRDARAERPPMFVRYGDIRWPIWDVTLLMICSTRCAVDSSSRRLSSREEAHCCAPMALAIWTRMR